MPELPKVELKKPANLEKEEFLLLRQLIFELSGICLQDHKQELLRARLFTRLQTLGLDTFGQYHKYLTSMDRDGEERAELLNAISTNKTEFFREKAHFEFLKEIAFPCLEKERVIRILCAGCSTGEEAYSLGITSYEYFGKETFGKVSIYACDVNTAVLEKAKNGIYSERQVASIPKPILHRFFLQGTGTVSGYVKVSAHLSNIIDFQHLNLMNRLPYDSPFNIIFCRNVVIYFNRETQARFFSRLYGHLGLEGYLVLGHSESITFFDLPYKYVQPSVYQKVSME